MKRIMMVALLVVALFALAACATGNEESGTATQSAIQSTGDAASTLAAATAAVVQATADAESAAATQAISDAQSTADAAATGAAGQPTDEPTDIPTVVPPTEEPTEEATAEATAVDATGEPTAEATTADATDEATAEATTDEQPTEGAQAATQEATAEPTQDAAATDEPTAEATEAATEEATAEATAEATTADATEEPTAEATTADATEEPTAEATTADATEEATTEATGEPTGEATARLATIAELALANPDLSTLVTLVMTADLAGVVGDPSASFTVFAPSNDAFAAVPADTLAALQADSELLTRVLSYHVVDGAFTTTDLAELTTATTMEMSEVGGEPIGSELTITNEDGSIQVDGANIVSPDIMASNGVIHIIDTVLIPADVAEALAQSAEPTDDVNAQATTEARQARATQRAENATATAGAVVPEATSAPTDDAAAPTDEAAAPTDEAAAPTDDASTGGATTVCLVTDLGRINDGGFNQSAYEGMLRAEADFGLTTRYIETQAQTDYEANINTCLDEGFDIVVTVGFLIYDATIAAAQANPDVFFIGVDQFPAETAPNFVGIQFREDQAGYLAGAMAALITETNKIGGVYGIDIPPVKKFRNGFEQGAKSINPDIELFGVYIPDFIAPQLGAEAAEAFVSEQGVDVVFGAGGPTGSGAIVRAAELGAWVIGVDQDEYNTTFGAGETPGADRIITSAMKRVDQGVYDMIAAVVEGGAGFPEGSLYLMDASLNGVGFAPAHDSGVSDEITAQVQAIFEQLASGELQTGVDPVSGDLLDAVTEGPAATDAPTEEAAPTDEAAATEEPTAEEAAPTDEPAATDAPTEEAAAPTEEAAAPTEDTAAATDEPVAEATSAPAGTGAAATTVCLVTDLGRINDGGFNQSAYEGMLRAEADFGLTTRYIETQAQTDYEANINTCLDEGFDIVVTVGFLIYDATIAAAQANPDVFFIGVDQFPAETAPNFVGIQFREDQAGYLAGAMAALVSETGKLGGVYGIDIPPVKKFRNGFEQGAKSVNPDIELFGVYIPDFIAPQLGAEAAEAFVSEQGVDVVFGAGGPTGSGAIVRAAELGAWVIGVDQDEYNTTFGAGETPGADRIITSAMKRVDQGVYDMIAAVVEGGAGFPEGSLYLMDASLNGVGFAPGHDSGVSDEVTEQVQAIFEQLASGELETGVDPVTGDLLDAGEGETDGDATAEPTEGSTEEPAATATPSS